MQKYKLSYFEHPVLGTLTRVCNHKYIEEFKETLTNIQDTNITKEDWKYLSNLELRNIIREILNDHEIREINRRRNEI